MKDIDFDELDRAVNSLMAPTDVSNSVQSAPVSSVPLLNPVAPSANPLPATSSDVPAPVENPTPATTSLSPASSRSTLTPPPRRAGRFMDMVHSSSDMKSRTPDGPREGVKITPMNPNVVPDSIVEEPSVEDVESLALPDSFTVQNLDNQLIEADTIDTTTMPDPLDIAIESTTVDLEPTVVQPEPAVNLEQSESPFLADAKVEKRPLNSDSLSAAPLVNLEDELNNELSDETDNESEDEAKIDSSKRDDEPPITPQVPELSSDLVAIESGDSVADDIPAPDVSPAQGDVVEDNNAAAAKPTGPTSIAQQYKAGDSSGNKDHTAIYDTSHYPEPLAHPAKKKAGFLWILWIILFLAIGGGGAVALYMLNIIP